MSREGSRVSGSLQLPMASPGKKDHHDQEGGQERREGRDRHKNHGKIEIPWKWCDGTTPGILWPFMESLMAGLDQPKKDRE